MALSIKNSHYGPKIVTDGLVLALDAGNTKSYDKYENLLTQSNTDVEFSNGATPNTWTSGYLAPDNSLTAKLCTTNNRSFKEYVSSSVNNVVSTFSIYLKSTGSSLSRTFDLRDIATDTIRATKSIVITGEWQRFDITGTVQANGVRIEITGGIQNIYAWGAQLERGSTANDYYSTTASTKTRGTTLTDLSLTKNNATLTNTPTFSNTNGGYLSFSSASSQYGTASNLGSLTRWTVETFVRFTSSYGTKVAMVVGNQYNGSASLNFTIGTNNAPTNYNIAVGFFDGAWRSTTGINYALNTWHHIVGTYDGTTIRQYTNGTQVDSLNYTGTPSSGGEVRINRRWDDVVSSGNMFDSNIATVRIYNRALTAAEVQQNYLATKSRFGL